MKKGLCLCVYKDGRGQQQQTPPPPPHHHHHHMCTEKGGAPSPGPGALPLGYLSRLQANLIRAMAFYNSFFLFLLLQKAGRPGESTKSIAYGEHCTERSIKGWPFFLLPVKPVFLFLLLYPLGTRLIYASYLHYTTALDMPLYIMIVGVALLFGLFCLWLLYAFLWFDPFTGGHWGLAEGREWNPCR